MRWLRIVRSRLVGLLRKGAVERDLDEELRFHLLMRTRENVARGLDPERARREAIRSFGNLDSIKERCRDVRGGGMLETLLKDMSFAIRRMLRSPGFTTVAVLSLALGIGANTAIFSLVNTVLLKPLPVERPEEIVSVFPVSKDDSVDIFSYLNYEEFRDRNEAFAGLYASRIVPMSMAREATSERVWGYLVSGNYFDALGVKAERGRTFLPEEDRTPLTHPVAVISHGCWQRRFGGDPGAVGSTIALNGRPFTVIGVAPEGFAGTEFAYTPELWVPIKMVAWIEPGSRWVEQRGSGNLFVGGRLRPGVSAEQAEASLNVLAAQLGAEYPDTNEGQTIALTPPGLLHPMLRGPVVSFTWVLMGVVGLVLLVACINLSNLLLARAVERRREVAVRLALGASRGRLVRQLLTESVLLSVVGGALGLLLGLGLVRLVSAFRPPIDVPINFDVTVDARVYAFTLVVSLVTGVVFGLVPALQATRIDLLPALKDGTSGGGRRRSLLRGGLVVAQVSLSLVLLVAAGLVVRALQQLQTTSPGFDPENALMLSVDVGLQGYDEAKGRQFYERLLERVRALPGVQSASLADFVPLSLNYNSVGVHVEEAPPVRGAEVPDAMNASVEKDYFATMRVPIVSGRGFDERDREGSPRVAVVNEAFARRFFPGASPAEGALGKRVGFGAADSPKYEIVGVAGDGKYFSIGEDPRPFVYFPLAKSYSSNAILLVRTASDPEAMIDPIRAEVVALDPQLPVFDVATLTRHMGLSLFPARIAASLLGAFGLLALSLAAIGVYGVMSHSVAQRTREIGVRMALGARPADVLRLVVRQGMALAGVGLVVGLAGAFVVARLMSSLLYGVSAADAATYLMVSALLGGVVFLACYVPAWRAARVDPMRALRYE